MDELLNVASVPAIAAVVYWVVNLVKFTAKNNEKLLTFIPLLAASFGVVCGIIAFLAVPEIMPTNNIVVAIVIGGASGLSATGFNQIIKQISKRNGDDQK